MDLEYYEALAKVRFSCAKELLEESKQQVENARILFEKVSKYMKN